MGVDACLAAGLEGWKIHGKRRKRKLSVEQRQGSATRSPFVAADFLETTTGTRPPPLKTAREKKGGFLSAPGQKAA
jgi:hypothetical protein